MRMRVWAARGVPAAEGRCAGCSTCRDAHDLRETQTVGLGAIQSLARPRDCFMCGETSNGRWCGATSWCLEVYQKFIIRRSKSDVQNQKWRLPTANAGSTRRTRSRHVPVSCRTSHVAVGWRGWPSLGQARQPRVALPICVSRFSGSHGFECPYLSILWG